MRADETARRLYEKACEEIKKQQFCKAQEYLTQSLDIEQTASAWHDLGVIQYMNSDIAGAVKAFQESVAIDPEYASSYANLARILHRTGDAKAFEYNYLAITADPENKAYKEEFITLMRNKKFMVFNAELKAMITMCLETDGIHHEGLRQVWVNFTKLDPSIRTLYKLASLKSYKSFRKELDSGEPEFLSDPFFLLGLQRFVIPDLDIEVFLNRLRRLCLERLADNRKDGFRLPVPLAVSIAKYCYYTEYIFIAGEEENEALNKLQKRIERHPESVTFQEIAMMGSYRPLASLENADEIALQFSGVKELASLIESQIIEAREIAELKKEIPAATETDTGISKEVRDQYEEFPYPKWHTVSNPKRFGFLPDNFGTGNIKILVAGCGTGEEVMEYALSFKNAEILAVDLSLTSLAYAKLQITKHGYENVTFRQADILKLGQLDQKFDIVTSMGVLHHMSEPESGWDVLYDLVKPGGYMRIGLYSELARQAVVAAREKIAARGYSSSADDIKKFRRECPKLLKKKNLEKLLASPDFYSLPACRDLLFHVHEVRFDIPAIQNYLDRHNLEFINFENIEVVIAGYRKTFPDDSECRNLDNWNAYEKANPDIFNHMYNFWCRKNSD